MSKAALQAAQLQYDQCMAAARNHERNGQLEEAIRQAIEAWEHLEGMMKFERKWEDREFKSVPCIDMVLRHAPMLLDGKSLDRLGDLLKEQRSIDKLASDDLAARLQEAKQRMRAIHQLLARVEAEPGITVTRLAETCGCDRPTVDQICERLEAMELIEVDRTGKARELRLATDFDRNITGLCESCGRGAALLWWDALSVRKCPTCGEEAYFVLSSGAVQKVQQE
jgi:predicted transcriptional regulator